MARPPAKAQRLADALSDQIRSGQLPAGTWLPAERQLADTHRVGRSTVRHALQMLCHTGLVEAVSGTGHRIIPADELLRLAQQPTRAATQTRT